MLHSRYGITLGFIFREVTQRSNGLCGLVAKQANQLYRDKVK